MAKCQLVSQKNEAQFDAFLRHLIQAHIFVWYMFDDELLEAPKRRSWIRENKKIVREFVKMISVVN